MHISEATEKNIFKVIVSYNIDSNGGGALAMTNDKRIYYAIDEEQYNAAMANLKANPLPPNEFIMEFDTVHELKEYMKNNSIIIPKEQSQTDVAAAVLKEFTAPDVYESFNALSLIYKMTGVPTSQFLGVEKEAAEIINNNNNRTLH